MEWAIPLRKKNGRRVTRKAHAFVNDTSLCGDWTLERAEALECVDFSGESGYEEVDYEDERRCKNCMNEIARRNRRREGRSIHVRPIIGR